MGGSWSISGGSPVKQGYWGAQTSAVNFCEEDYAITYYVAEFFNTLTSLAYACYGIHGIQRYKRQGIGPFATVNLPYWGLITVGICSGIYHLTLKYHTQMADEMSMHLAMGCVLIQVFTFQQPPEIQRRNTIIIVVGLTSFIIYHCVTDEFIMHVTLFVTLVLTVIWKTRQIIKERIQNEDHKKKMSALATFGTCCAGLAYGLWNIDVNFCPMLTRWKQQVGMPLAVLLELHGWWHILTAIAAYAFMAMVEFLTCPEHDESHGIGFAWPAAGVLSDIIPRKLMNGDSKANGKHQTSNNVQKKS